VSVFRADYSALDRTLHRFALGGLGLQKMMAEVEDDLYARKLRGIELAKPVFITSLPRAGTTLLLNVLSQLPGFATHSYRNMPFLLCPLIWDSVTRRFRKQSALRERAHGDGMTVGFDSPEAFEEVVWKAFWPGKYHERSIEIWRAEERSAEFEDFLRSHMRKILLLKLGTSGAAGGAGTGRYISKNNANIARLDLLPRLFPDCRIVVPFRNPRDHVASLLRQHRNFLQMHADDPFAADYMASIGHHDFGAGLKPIDFDGWLSGEVAEPSDPSGDPLRPAFWLRYWLAGFRFLSGHVNASVVLLDYDALCRDPEPGITRLLQAIDCDTGSASTLASQFRAPTAYEGPDLDVDAVLLEQAQTLHRELAAAALKAES
jgi:hypothetical protein